MHQSVIITCTCIYKHLCTFVITAYSYISGTCAMEGFDARRVYTLLNIDDSKYSIPMIISVGKMYMYVFLSLLRV